MLGNCRLGMHYRNVKRLGRKTGLPEKHRAECCGKPLNQVKRRLREEGLVTRSEMFGVLAEEVTGRVATRHSIS